MLTLLRTRRFLLLLMASLVATALPVSAATIASFYLDVTITDTGVDDGMGGTLGDFGLSEGEIFSNAGVLTVVSGEPDPDGIADLIQVTAFDLSLGSAALHWDLADVTGPPIFGFALDGVVQDVYLPIATNEAGVTFEGLRRKKAGSPPIFFDPVNIFDDQNSIFAEVTVRPIPEPGAMALMATGVLLVAWQLRSRR